MDNAIYAALTRQSGLMRVNASETAPGQLTGTWSALDSAGTTVVSGAWQAKKN